VSESAYHESLWEAVPEGLEPADYKRRLSFLLELVPPAARVLDVGCGEGQFMAALIDAGAHPVGIDVAQTPLARAIRRRQDLELHLVSPDGPWPFEDASFDLVWAGEVIEHVLDTARWLSEIRRVLRSGASLALSTPANGRIMMFLMALGLRSFEGRFDPRSDHIRFYTAGSLRHLLEELGFEQVHVSAAGGPPGARELLLARATRSRF
jgi:SAM-dependent methyltransferase